MRFHVPKPLHGWREFAGEVGIIVLGVLIALGLGQIASAIQDRANAREARASVYDEINQNLSYIKARMETQPCVERRLDEIGDLLERAGDGAMSPQPKWIGQPSTWLLSDQRWEAATGSGRASLFNTDEQGGLASVYVITQQFVDSERSEQDAWAQLRGLESWNGPLGAVGRVHFVSALQSARYELWQTGVLAKVAFQRAKALGFRDFQPKMLMNGYRIPHAVCIPIDTPRQQALQILGGNNAIRGQPK